MEQNPDKNTISPVAINAIIIAIKSIAPMAGEDIELLVSIIQYQKVKKNSYLLKEGKICLNAYFLTSGFLRMFYVDKEGNEINYRFAAKNNFLVDFQSFLTQKPSRFTWQAMEDSELIVLSYRQIQNAYAGYPIGIASEGLWQSKYTCN